MSDTTTDKTGTLTEWARQRRQEEVETYKRARALVLEHVPHDRWVGPGELVGMVAAAEQSGGSRSSSTRLLTEAMYSLADERTLERNRHGQVRHPRNGHR